MTNYVPVCDIYLLLFFILYRVFLCWINIHNHQLATWLALFVTTPTLCPVLSQWRPKWDSDDQLMQLMEPGGLSGTWWTQWNLVDSVEPGGLSGTAHRLRWTGTSDMTGTSSKTAKHYSTSWVSSSSIFVGGLPPTSPESTLHSTLQSYSDDFSWWVRHQLYPKTFDHSYKTPVS